MSNRGPIAQDQTAQARFTTTHWSVVLAAGSSDSPAGMAALEVLCETYWFPIYAFLRRQGRDAHQAKDLTQEFLAHFLAQHSLERVDADKGKFRSFLLSCLNHFLCNEHDRQRAAKRGGGKVPISLDELAAEEKYQFEPASGKTPEELFEKQWALKVLEQALERLEEEFGAAGRAEHFRRLRGFLEGDVRSGDYPVVAAELNSTPGAVAIAVHRLRRRYRELVRAEIGQTVAGEEQIDQEMQHLQQALSR